MKMDLLVTLAGLAIWFAVPVLAQQKGGVDRQTVQQHDLLGVAKAIDDFGAVSLKLGEDHSRRTTPAPSPRFLRRTGFR